MSLPVLTLVLASSASTSSAQAPLPRYAVQHVIFGKSQLDLLTTGAWSHYVHDERDAFLLMSGNNEGSINCDALNAWAATVRSYYPTAPIHAATSGIWNVINGAPCLDKTLFSGMTLVYEPNQPNAPEFSWDRATTEELLAYASRVIRENGLESWTKISGRAVAGRDKEGEWDYGVFGTLLDGQVIQTQGSCRDLDGDGDYVNGKREFGAALASVIDMNAAAGATSPLHIRITTSSDATNVNTVGSADAVQCAEAAWARPEVARVTLRTAVGDIESLDRATAFYQLREVLLAGAPSVFAQPASPPPVSAQLPSSGTATTAGTAPELPAEGQIHGTLPSQGLGLIVWGGGAIDVLAGAAEGAGCSPQSMWLIEGGKFLGYLANAPAAVNAAFFSHFRGGDLPAAPVIVRCGGG